MRVSHHTLEKWGSILVRFSPLILIFLLTFIHPFWTQETFQIVDRTFGTSVLWVFVSVFFFGLLFMYKKVGDIDAFFLLSQVFIFLALVASLSFASDSLTRYSFFGTYSEIGTLISFLSMSALFMMGYFSARGGNTLKKMLLVLVYSISVTSVLAVIFALFGHEVFGRAFEQYLFVSGAFLGALVLISTHKNISRSYFLLWGCLTILGLFLSTSDSFILLASTAVGGYLLLAVLTIFRRKLCNVFLLLVVTILMLSSFFVGTSASHIALDMPSSIVPSTAATIQVISSSFTSDPYGMLYGVGAYDFSLEWNEHLPKKVNSSQFWDVDFTFGSNLFLSILFMFGVPFALSLSAGIFLFIFYIFSRVYKSHFGAERDMQIWLIVVVPLVYFLSFFFIPSLSFLAVIALLAGVSVGVIHAQKERASFSSTAISTLMRTLIGLLLLCSLVISFMLVKHTLALLDYASALTFSQNNNLSEVTVDSFENYLKQSVAHAPLPISLHSLALLHISYTQDAFKDYENTGSVEAGQIVRDSTEQAMGYAQEAVLLAPKDYRLWLTLGNAQVRMGLYTDNIELIESGRVSYKQSQNLAPNRPHAFVAQAELEILTEDHDSAQALLDKALSLKSDHEGALELQQILDRQYDGLY